MPQAQHADAFPTSGGLNISGTNAFRNCLGQESIAERFPGSCSLVTANASWFVIVMRCDYYSALVLGPLGPNG
jgi:hypothetical protein